MISKIRLMDIDTALEVDEAVRKNDPYADKATNIDLYGLPHRLFNGECYDVVRLGMVAIVIYDNDRGQTWNVPYYLVRAYMEEDV